MKDHGASKPSKFKSSAEALFFTGPSILLFLAVVIVPFLYGIYLTMTDWNGISAVKNFVGIENYRAMAADQEFWTSLGRTMVYSLLTVIFSNLIALILARLLTYPIPGRNFLRAGFFTPNLIGGLVLGYIWNFIFNRAILVIGDATGWPLFSSSWLSDPTKAFWALVIVSVWQLSGYLMLIYIAGFTGIPQELHEAARIDGASRHQVLWQIDLPLLANTTTICIFLALTRSFVTYDVNISLTNGGPYNSTRLASMYVYNMAFSSKKYGLGQAEALILFIVIAVIALIQTYLGKKQEVTA